MFEVFSSDRSGELVYLDFLSSEYDNFWVNVVSPSAEDIELLSSKLNIDPEAFHYVLDENECSRIEVEDSYSLIILNYPVIKPSGYDTYPIGIILAENAIITVANDQSDFLNQFAIGKIKTPNLHSDNQVILQICYRLTRLFMTYLTQMGKRLEAVEEHLKDIAENSELIKLLNINNSLIYFSTALRGNYTVLERLLRGPLLHLSPDNKELLQDIIVENKQALEMTQTYISILSNTTDAYASIMNNNLNKVLKFMTAWTIVVMVPTFITSLYGMNIALPGQSHAQAFLIIVLICITMTSILVGFFMKKKFF